MAPTTPAKGDAKSAAGDNKDAEFLIYVMQSLKTEPQVDLDKLAQLSGMASKASAATKWYKIRQKYMPNGVTPKKRKGQDDGDSSKAAKPKTPRKNKTSKKEEPKGETGSEEEAEIKGDPFRVKRESSGVEAEQGDEE